MPCSVTFLAINGIVPPGQTSPTLLRVTGEAFQCPSNHVEVTSSITGPSGPVPVDPATGRFRVELPITASPAPSCGDTIGVRAECIGSTPACFAEDLARTLTCCEIGTLFFDARVPLGSLAPTQLVVQGNLTGCPTDQVNLSASKAGQPIAGTIQPIPVNQYDGAFNATLPITPTPPTTVNCDDEVTVTATCASNPACSQTVRNKLSCVGCYRARITQTPGTCTGAPPVQPITLDGTINIPASQTMTFQWDFGDGTSGPPFTVNNSTGTATTPHTRSETHNYAPGTYTATLRVVPPPSECDEVTVTVVAQCASCPTITVGPPTIATQCVGGKRTVTLTAQITAASGQLAVVQWDFGDGSLGPATVVNAGTTLPYSQAHDYAPPGPYTATLRVIVPQVGCPDTPVQISVPPCPPPPCTLVIQNINLTVGPCNPATNTRTVTATAVLNNTDPTDLYWWQWDANPAQVGLPAPQGVTQQHDYPAPGPGQSTETVKLVVTRGINRDCVASLSKQVTLDPCDGCPEATGIGVAPGSCPPGATVRPVTLTAQVAGTGVTEYEWEFGDGSPNFGPPGAASTPPHNYAAPGTYTARVTVRAPNCPDSSTTTTVNVAACPTDGGGGGSISCAVLLWAAIILMLIGAVLVVLGCLLSTKFPTAGLVLMIIGGIVFGLGWLLFVLWLIFCSAFTECAVILAVRDFVIFLIFFFAVVAAVIAVLALFTDKSLWPCAAAAAVFGLNWGAVLAILDKVAEARGCLIPNPGGASPSKGAGSSGSSPPPADWSRSQPGQVGATGQGGFGTPMRALVGSVVGYSKRARAASPASPKAVRETGGRAPDPPGAQTTSASSAEVAPGVAGARSAQKGCGCRKDG